jgi:DNA-binding CsgD family transcriptional regulator
VGRVCPVEELGTISPEITTKRDIEAVVDRHKLERFLILGVSFGVDLAVDYALQHPQKVIALMLGTSGEPRSSALFRILPAEDWDAFLHSIVPRDRSREEGNRIVELTKQASDQKNLLLRWRVLGSAGEIEGRLSRLCTETLVMHARDYALTPVEEGMKKAQFSGGRMVLLDGSDPFGDADQGNRAIENFLADVAPDEETRHAGFDGPTGGREPSRLSSREIEVLRLLATGKSNQQIADELVISLNTVLRHVSNIFAKTGATNRTEAAGYARDRSLI